MTTAAPIPPQTPGRPSRRALVRNALAVAGALKDPELEKRLREQGGEPAPMTQAQFRDFIKTETAKYARIVDAAKIVAE